MSTIAEIEAAIEKLPAGEIDELVGWIEALRAQRAKTPPVDSGLQRARGAALPGVTTDSVLSVTRDEE